ncbi:MAG TPA: hypothetical protein VFY39_15345 [Gammaproteobacteria bacterium]|nr:hypothetical protein [Gammaproteobacteria bacterium]
MRTFKKIFGLSLILFALLPVAQAQEGYPLAGTWQGYWGKTPNHRQFLTIVMQWDGHVVSGRVNPGPREGTLRSVNLDTSDWTVEMVMDVKEASGETVRLTAEGRLENIGSHNRSVRGIWQHGGDTGIFSISRQ